MDRGGPEVADRIVRGRTFGIFFHVVFASNEVVSIDSNGDLGNIGMPSSYEEKRHLRRMLEQTANCLTEADTPHLIDRVED